MTEPARWQKVKEIVGKALERQPAERASYLDTVCLDDSDLRSEVDSLLAASSDGDALSKVSWGMMIAGSWTRPGFIGPYRLERELGSGGMGQVWLAEQTEPLRRWVALKLIRGGVYDRTLVERFLAERHSQALMNHPAIAKVFDAGTTETGQPYLAMEYVEGLSIAAYCDEKELGVAERLRLFLQVCEGVQHAHQKAIIHRDLKPSNILVVEVDGKPTPRIIDFGLAKSALAGDMNLTQMGSFLGTPAYMSPEQLEAASAEGGPVDVDTRADVYSLGVILYELLAGCLPFDTPRSKRDRFEDGPVRPSTKAGTSKTPAEATARMLRGDLDSITLKALERDRERRYGSPAELAFNCQEAKPPANWEAVNTNFGDLSRPFQDFVAAQSIQERVAASAARVLIFPEFVVPRWSDATVAFWQQTLDGCRTRGQILAMGAGLPRTFEIPQDRATHADMVKSYDFAGAIQVLRGNDGRMRPSPSGSETPANTPGIPFNNTLLILGSESATVYQRVPVPIGMWNPFAGTGVPLRLNEPGIVRIDGQRVAVLICYEQILAYPILASMLQRPNILVGISNAFWFTGTSIPRYQANAVRAWARLLAVPYLLAVNS